MTTPHVSRETRIRFFGKRKPLHSINKKALVQSILAKAKSEGKTIRQLNYVLVSDDELLQINIDHLQHDYYTDIITFDLSESEDAIEGEIYVSWERVKENAETLHTQDTELLRVLFHGALHLMGYGDKSTKEEKLMRQKEDECVNLYLETMKQLDTVSRETHAI